MTPEYPWVRDLGWGVVGGDSTFALHTYGCGVHESLGAHVDDATTHLSDLMARCPWDVMKAFTVAPNGDMTLKEAGAAWPMPWNNVSEHP